jgi:hypothetical protein
MPATNDCRSCVHYRATRPEPFSAADLRRPEVAEESEKWREHLVHREHKETERVDRGDISLDYEPWFYAWCGHYSSPAEDAVDPRDQEEGVYLLAEAVNTDGDCPAFEPKRG